MKLRKIRFSGSRKMSVIKGKLFGRLRVIYQRNITVCCICIAIRYFHCVSYFYLCKCGSLLAFFFLRSQITVSDSLVCLPMVGIIHGEMATNKLLINVSIGKQYLIVLRQETFYRMYRFDNGVPFPVNSWN